MSSGLEQFTEILNEIRVTQLLSYSSQSPTRSFQLSQRFWKKESSGKADESHYYLQHMCRVSPEKSINTSATGGRRGMGVAITTCLLRSLMLESHKLAKSHQLWQQELEQQQP